MEVARRVCGMLSDFRLILADYMAKEIDVFQDENALLHPWSSVNVFLKTNQQSCVPYSSAKCFWTVSGVVTIDEQKLSIYCKWYDIHEAPKHHWDVF